MLAAINCKIILENHKIWKKLEKEFSIKYLNTKKLSRDEVIEELKGIQYVLVESFNIDRNMIEELGELKYIGVLATGYNMVDIEAASENKITVTNIPHYGSDLVAQHTFSLITSITSNIKFYDKLVREGQWDKRKIYYDSTKPIIELSGKTLGIMGYGNIGKKVEKIAHSYGLSTIIYDKVKFNAENQVSLDELYKHSDIISVNLPLNEETKNIIDKTAIEKMKDGVIIVNTARGGLIVDEDLAKALNTGKVYGAGLDVISKEPIKMDNPLLECENVIITPHIAWASIEARSRLLETGYENLKKFIEGDIINKVN